ncbi:MAG: hypothetical protein LRZ88_04865 [Candidatus Cloacimonetes bacterium]|nr:hypothetical protein [Candidatus Cloacimonadota bacterium]
MKPAFRNDAHAKVTGTAKYTDDYTMPRMLHAVPLHAPVASAMIKSIDSSEAQRAEGVIRVITAADIPGSIKFGQIIRDYPTLASDRIRSSGDVFGFGGGHHPRSGSGSFAFDQAGAGGASRPL